MRRELPSGTVTFLFTDVEGSTRLLLELGEQTYADVLSEHRRLARQAIADHGGVEVDTQGDAFFVAFAEARSALDAATTISQVPGPIAVRIGIHTGAAYVVAEGYVGIEVHRAARIAAAGHGGQILASETTAALVGRDGLRDLGEHRLKDLSASLRIFQLGDGEFPPLNTLLQTNLPVPATPFLGRDRELAEVGALLARPETRLVTLTGPGGTGKTRLALQLAASVGPAYPDGVWWVPLAPLRDPDLVLDLASQAVGAKSDLVSHLAGRSLLLVLDNFEQVLDAAADVAGVVSSCPNVDVVVTSREPLHVSGEQEYPVPPLAHDEGVSLFLARARSVVPDFDEDASVSEICNRLDDLPLALELAAARVKALSSAELLQKLDTRLPLLTGGARDLPERQRTLRATIEWSYELLTDRERELFARLSIFAGGWSLDAAADVADADLDTLQSLVDKSLVTRHADRFAMLETIREYGLERLAEEDRAEAHARHARYFETLALESEAHVTGASQRAWLEHLAEEHENLRSALEFLLERGESERALRLASSLVVYWFVRGHYAEGRGWLEKALEGSPRESAALAKSLWGAGFLGVLAADFDQAPAQLEQGLAVARAVGDASTVARCLSFLGLLAFFRDDPDDARRLLEESIDAARSAGDTWCLADGLGTLGSIVALQGDLDVADAASEEGLAVARKADDEQGVRMSLFGRALTALRRDDPARALRLSDEGLAVSRSIRDPWFVAYFQWIRGSAALALGDLAAARSAADEALVVALEARATLIVVCAREVLGRLEWAEGDERGAEAELGEALAAASEGGVPGSYVATVHLTLGRLLASGGRTADGRRHLETSLATACSVRDTWVAAQAHSALDSLRARA